MPHICSILARAIQQHPSSKPKAIVKFADPDTGLQELRSTAAGRSAGRILCEASVVALRPLSQDHSAAYSNIRAVERVAKGDKRGKLAKNYVAGRAMLPVASGEDGSAVQYMRISEGRLGDSTQITGPLSAGDVVPVIDKVRQRRSQALSSRLFRPDFTLSAGPQATLYMKRLRPIRMNPPTRTLDGQFFLGLLAEAALALHADGTDKTWVCTHSSGFDFKSSALSGVQRASVHSESQRRLLLLTGSLTPIHLNASPPQHWTDTLVKDLAPEEDVVELCRTVGLGRVLGQLEEVLFLAEAWQMESGYNCTSKGTLTARADANGIFTVRSLRRFCYADETPTPTARMDTHGILLRRQRRVCPREMLLRTPGCHLEHPLSTALLDPCCIYHLRGPRGPFSAQLDVVFLADCLGMAIAPLALQAIMSPALEAFGLTHAHFTVASVCSSVDLGLMAFDALRCDWRLTRYHERCRARSAIHERGWANHRAAHYEEATTPPPSGEIQEDVLIISPNCGPVSSKTRRKGKELGKHLLAALAEMHQIFEAQLRGRSPSIVIVETSASGILQTRALWASFIITSLKTVCEERYEWSSRILCTHADLGASTRRPRLFFRGMLKVRPCLQYRLTSRQR